MHQKKIERTKKFKKLNITSNDSISRQDSSHFYKSLGSNFVGHIDPAACFISMEKFAMGGNNVVIYEGLLRNGEKVAIKRLEYSEQSLNEIALQCLHAYRPHSVEFYFAFRSGKYAFIVMELMNESLEECIEKEFFDEEEMRRILTQILLGLKDIHDCDQIHNDLKPGNIMMKGRQCKIGDYGLSRYCKKGSFVDGIRGTWNYMAPEILMRKQYNQKVDIFSLGIIALEMAEKNNPHFAKNTYEHAYATSVLGCPSLTNKEHFSKEFNNFIELCLNKHPNDRPTCDELLSHDFIKGSSSTGYCTNIKEELNKLMDF